MKIKRYQISYAAFRAKRNSQREAKLQEKLHEIEEILGTIPSSETVKIYFGIKQELETIYMEKVNVAAIRSRAEFVENNERNSKFFLGLEKENYNLIII